MCRSTASTNMNSASSRSHAIFTLHIKQQRLIEVSNFKYNIDSRNHRFLSADQYEREHPWRERK